MTKKTFWFALVALITIPGLGYFSSILITNNLDSKIKENGWEYSVADLCQLTSDASLAKLDDESTQESIRLIKSACSQLDGIFLLRTVSQYTALAGLAVLLFYWFGSLLAGRSRTRLALIFPTLVRITVLAIAGLVVLHGGIVTYAAYVSESYWIGRVHFIAIGLVGLAAVGMGLQLIAVALKFNRRLETSVIGKKLTKQDAPGLFSFVGELATKLKATPPSNIVVGLDPTFYVTSCDVKVIGETTDYCKGETLFISATLARLLSVEELSAVLGHELGHFSGKDTLYSLKFAPVYAGLRDAVSAINLNDNDGGLALVKIPALLLFTYMVDAFSTNESFVSRKREHEADKAAIEVSSASHLATALMKVTIYSGLWDKIRTDNIARLNKGKVVSNLSQTFVDSAKYDIEHEKLTSIVEFALSEKISHPTDTHPTLAERLSNLNVDFSTISKEMLLAPEVSASGKIDKYEEIEQNITIFEHQLMIALDRVQLPKEEKDNYFLKMTYCFAAAMVRVDGKIENDEIAVAEEIGMRLFSDFDSAEFREYFSGELELATVTSLAEVLKDAVDQETKEQIYSYLRLIAAADDEISAEEEALLSEIARAMDFVPISNTEPKQAVANQ